MNAAYGSSNGASRIWSSDGHTADELRALSSAIEELRTVLDKIRSRPMGDVVVMDVQMSDVSADTATRKAGICRIVFMSDRGDRDVLARPGEDHTEGGGIPLPEETASNPNGRPARITSREREVLKDVAAGMSNKQIARRLGLSQKTIKNHLSRTFSKLEACNRTEAVMRAVRVGMLDM